MYPVDHDELVDRFGDEVACAKYLVQLRWPDGYVCEACGVVDDPWWGSSSRLICRHCRAQRSLRAGTIFEQTKTPFTTWFSAAWLVATANEGMSAKTLQRTLGVSYNTAWAMLHRFRVAMVRSERPRLTGTVEVDETFLGGVSTGGKAGRGSEKRVPVAVAVEMLEPKGFGRCRLALLPDAGKGSIEGFVFDAVQPGATLLTDAWPSYASLSDKGYDHRPTNLTADPRPAHKVHPGVHRVASLLKRWLMSTHQGAVRREHLQSYLEEYTFRFNRRKARSRGLVFHRLLEQGMLTPPVLRREVVGGWWTPRLSAPGESPDGAVRTLVVTDQTHTRRRLNQRLADDDRFAPLAAVPADPPTVIRHIDQLGIELAIVDGDSHERTAGLATQIREETGAKVAVYATQADRVDFVSSKADVRVAKASGKALLNLCYELFPSTDDQSR